MMYNGPEKRQRDIDKIPVPVRREMLLKSWEIGYGFPDEWRAFAERNRDFIDAFPELMEFSWAVFSPKKTYALTEAYQVIAFSLLGLAQEDFQHILCLAVNAYGSGAQARVRTMFERVVLAAYFIKFPDQAEPYLHFEMVERRKRLYRAHDLYSALKYKELRNRLERRIDELTREIQSFKSRFGKGFSKKWTDVGFDELSSRVGLQNHYLYCYLVPNAFVHATPADLAGRIVAEKQLYFQLGPDPSNADEALKSAHVLLVWSFAVADQLLQLRRKTAIKELSRKCVKIYRTRRTRLVI